MTALLRRVFDLAHIRFGRIDYGVLNGVPQVWEINTNPTMGRNPTKARKVLAPDVQALKEQARESYHARLRPAFEALGREAAGTVGTVAVGLDPVAVRRVEGELASAERRRRLLTMARGIYEHPRASALRSVLRWVVPPPVGDDMHVA